MATRRKRRAPENNTGPVRALRLTQHLLPTRRRPGQLDDLVELLDGIEEHLEGIRQHGNVHYWENVYEKPLPPDEYGITYG